MVVLADHEHSCAQQSLERTPPLTAENPRRRSSLRPRGYTKETRQKKPSNPHISATFPHNKKLSGRRHKRLHDSRERDARQREAGTSSASDERTRTGGMGKETEIQYEEMQKHNTAKDCWMAIHGKVRPCRAARPSVV